MVGGDKNKEQATKKYQKSYFDVLGLCCSSEVPLIEKILKPLDGIKEVSVIVPSRTVIVLHDNLIISQLQIATLLNQARLEANIRVYGETKFSNKWPSPYAIACGVCLLLSFLKYVYHPFQWLALGAVVIGILPIVLKGYAALRNFTLDTNILVLIAVMGSIALRDYWEAGSIVFLFTIAQWLESRASHKANAVMSSLMNMVPQKAVMAESGEEVDASEVKVESILAVKPGEIIPIDGIVVDGKCDVDEKTLTGESFPIPKQNESTVWAGTINLNGYISVKTTALAEDCVVARMAKLVEEAQNNKSKTQRFIDKCAKFYTPAIVAISISLAAIPAILRVHNQRHWFHLALVVLVSACPCALILSTPVATFCALSKAATSGLLIKGGEYLETLSKIKIMGFDKTGTITTGEFMVKEFQTLVTDVSINELLYWVSSIESKSSHPMAAALIDYGRSHSIEPNSEDVQEFENFPGEGIHGKIDGKDIYVGNRKIALRAGCETVPSLKGTVGEGKSIGYVLLGGVPAGVFSLSDTCRSGAKEAINDLKSMGIKTAMLTGDSNEAAIQAQNQLEGCLEVVHAELLPQDKANIIKQFQKEAPTAMVGDGLNDAPALATADIGISMGVSGSALATETGHVILMSNDIRKIPEVIMLSRRTQNKVIQNVLLSILTKSGILVLAFVGYPFVWAAVLADVGTCLVVIFNSMLLLKGEENQTEKCCKSSWKTGFRKQGCDSDHGCHSSHSHKHEHLAERDVGCKSHGCHSSHSHEHSIGVKKIHCSTSCNGHGSSSNLGQTNGCCSNGDQLKEAKHLYNKHVRNQWCKSHSCHSSHTHEHEHSIGVGKIHHPTSCDSHENCSNPGQTNGCCVNKDRLKETEHSNNKHFGKQGCKSRSCYSSHSHKHEHSIRVEKNHDHSMSRDSHGNCPNSRRANGRYVNKDRLKEAEHSDHKNLGSNSEHKHCCSGPRVSNHCEPKKCTNLVKKQNNCGKRDVVQGHFDHISPNDIHCHSTHCNNKHRETRAIDDEEAVLDQTNDEHEKYEVDFPCSSIHKNKELEGSRACLELEKRHIGGCCRSFREECCGRNKQFGESFRGGLSEIIIE